MEHYSVLRNETLEGLNINPDGIYVDGTTGGGGHSEGILNKLGKGKLICIDRDDYALGRAKKRLCFDTKNTEKVSFVKGDFKNLPQILGSMGIKRIDGMVLDLGVSSFQLDDASRGFSYKNDAPLDMRMDQSSGMTAGDVVNEYDEQCLKIILRDFGEERFAARIAAKICSRREDKRIETTLELAEIIKDAIPAAARRTGPHPAKRSFQAIRIEVNAELQDLKKTVIEAVSMLNPNGRMAVISFHSLEDRAVKAAFSELAEGCTCPKDLPLCVCGRTPKIKIVTRKPILPTDRELSENNRSRSAKLRIAEKT